MFDMSWGEVLVIGTVALVAIGPKDLPKALRMAGQAVGKVRRMAGEFQAQFNEAMREADLEELRKTASDINDAVAPFKSQFDPLKSASEQLQKAVGLPDLPELPPIDAASPQPAAGTVTGTPAPTADKPAEPVRKTRKAPAKQAEGAKAGSASGRGKPAAKTAAAKAKSAPVVKKQIAEKKPVKKSPAGEKA